MKSLDFETSTRTRKRHTFQAMTIVSLLILLSLHWTGSAPPPNQSAKFLERHGLHPSYFNAASIGNGNVYYTNLESLRDLLIHVRNATLIKSLANMEELLAFNDKMGKLQRRVPDDQPFPCDLSKNARSKKIPSNIGKLRPGDIDIVAAFGDSMTAGNGLLSKSWQDVANEYRGFSFIGGGIDNWRNALTLPNILKLFNPQLYGYAIGHSLMVDKEIAGFNIAEPMLTIRDLPFQARVLIDRMQNDPNVDMQKHWKLLTIYVGFNDICFEICDWDNVEAYLWNQWKTLHQTFTLLRDNIPRLMISIVLPTEPTNLSSFLNRASVSCYSHFLCSCLGIKRQTKTVEAIQRLRLMPLQLSELSEFRRDDFVIVTHDIFANMLEVFTTNNKIDMRFFSHDCMHHSQRAHAILASALWNSMLEKFQPNETEEATTNWRKPVQHLICPREGRRYLRIR